MQDRTLRPLRRRLLVGWLPVALCAAVIFILSAQPHLQPPLRFWSADKVYHLIEYGVFGALLARAVRGSMAVRAPVVAAALAITIGSAYAATDEWHQSFVPGRESDVRDWLADTAGCALAQLVVARLAKE